MRDLEVEHQLFERIISRLSPAVREYMKGRMRIKDKEQG